MKKDDLIKAMDEERERFLDVIEGLEENDFLLSGVSGDWSVKDILVHLTRWEAELVKLLWQVKQGQKITSAFLSTVPEDEINNDWYQASRDRLLQPVLDDFLGIRNQTIRRVEEFSETALIDKSRYSWMKGHALWEWIAGTCIDHEAEHGNQIQIWRHDKGA